MNTPFFDAVVPTPSASPTGGASEVGGQDQAGAGSSPMSSPFFDAALGSIGQSASPNSLSGVPNPVEIVSVPGAPGRGEAAAQPSMLETPAKNLARG